LSSLNSVGDYWMDGYDGGFSKMVYINVENKQYPEIVGNDFCLGWGDGGFIDGSAASTWITGGLENWTYAI